MKNVARNLGIFFLSFLVFGASAFAQGNPVYVGFDGSYGVKNSTSAQSIELGLRAAIHEINAGGGVLGGRPIELVVKDNRSVAARGIANLDEFAATEDLVGVFGGRFSPVILQQLEHAQNLQMLLLDVWGSADGITDNTLLSSYSFRLSLKDSWAMPAMLFHAQTTGGNKVGVLLPNTGWGRSNQQALVKAMVDSPKAELVGTIWYNWGEEDMLQHYQSLINAGAQAVLLVANDLEGSLLVRQLGANPQVRRVPIVSHWGVTGGNMVEASGPTLSDLNFSVIQTFSFFTARPAALKTFKQTVKDIAGIEDMEHIASPVGVGHAYDMMHLLAQAIDMAGSTNRVSIRNAMENLGTHEGLVKTYLRPFSPDKHDALGPEQVFLAKYRADGVLVPIKK